MSLKIKFLIFATSWMFFRAIGSAVFLSITILAADSPRSAPPEWIVSLIGDFIVGSMALFLAYYAYKNPTSILWGILLAWNILGIFDLFGAMVLTFIVPYQPLPEIGLNEIVSKASICSVILIVPISAVIVAPILPVMTNAVTIGESSNKTDVPITLPKYLSV